MDRTPLEKKYVTDTGEWLEDSLGWIRSQATVKKGLKYFYDKTGVMPYLVVTETINQSVHPTGQEAWDYGNLIYDDHFDDEGHLVFVFQCEDNGTDYTMAGITGAMAKTVIDDEALEILYDYMDYYFNSDVTEDEMFSGAFRDAADRIMTKTPNYTALYVRYICGTISVIAICFIVKAVHKRRKEAAEETQRILNAPVETIGDEKVDTLASKYSTTGADSPK